MLDRTLRRTCRVRLPGSSCSCRLRSSPCRRRTPSANADQQEPFFETKLDLADELHLHSIALLNQELSTYTCMDFGDEGYEADETETPPWISAAQRIPYPKWLTLLACDDSVLFKLTLRWAGEEGRDGVAAVSARRHARRRVAREAAAGATTTHPIAAGPQPWRGRGPHLVIHRIRGARLALVVWRRSN